MLRILDMSTNNGTVVKDLMALLDTKYITFSIKKYSYILLTINIIKAKLRTHYNEAHINYQISFWSNQVVKSSTSCHEIECIRWS